MAIIDIDIQEYAYQEHVILSAVKLAIERNDCVGLIGLNGAGKTTLLRLLLNFAPLLKGQIDIEGVSAQLPSSRKSIFYLPEKFHPADFFTGKEYLDYMARAYKVNRESKQSSYEYYVQLAEQVALDESALNKKLQQYSKGMLQKIGIMSAMLSKQSIWVLDEPMSGLDPLARALFKQVIQSAIAEGKTVLLCTHMLSDVKSLCNKLLALHQGQVAYSGSPDGLLSKTKEADDLETAFLALVNTAA